MSTARALAWSSVVVAVLLVVGRELILSRPHPELLQTETTGNPLLSLVAIFAFPIVGAIIVSLRPRHPELVSAARDTVRLEHASLWLRAMER